MLVSSVLLVLKLTYYRLLFHDTIDFWPFNEFLRPNIFAAHWKNMARININTIKYKILTQYRMIGLYKVSSSLDAVTIPQSSKCNSTMTHTICKNNVKHEEIKHEEINGSWHSISEYTPWANIINETYRSEISQIQYCEKKL